MLQSTILPFSFCKPKKQTRIQLKIRLNSLPFLLTRLSYFAIDICNQSISRVQHSLFILLYIIHRPYPRYGYFSIIISIFNEFNVLLQRWESNKKSYWAYIKQQ